MECNELLALLTLGAIAPYLTEAVVRWFGARNVGATSAGARQRCACQTTRQD